MPQEKVAVLRRHLEKAVVWDLCQETGLHPSLFYHWLKEFFEHGAAAFEHRSRGDKQQQEVQQRRIAALEEKLKAKNEVLAELMEKHGALEKVLGRSEEPMGTPRHPRPGDGLVPLLAAEERALHPPLHRLVGGVTTSKFYDWQARYGKVNEHNGWVPREFWLEAGEKQAILDSHRRDPLAGYRRLTFMVLDADIVAASPASVWRVLHRAGCRRRPNLRWANEGAARVAVQIGENELPQIQAGQGAGGSGVSALNRGERS